MLHVDDHIDDLLRRAAEDYPLKTDGLILIRCWQGWMVIGTTRGMKNAITKISFTCCGCCFYSLFHGYAARNEPKHLRMRPHQKSQRQKDCYSPAAAGSVSKNPSTTKHKSTLVTRREQTRGTPYNAKEMGAGVHNQLLKPNISSVVKAAKGYLDLDSELTANQNAAAPGAHLSALEDAHDGRVVCGKRA